MFSGWEGWEMRVSQDFLDDFNLCVEYYGCDPDEIEYEKRRVNDGYAQAKRCFGAIADEIRRLGRIEDETRRIIEEAGEINKRVCA